MLNIEKVIKGLECCKPHAFNGMNCKECPYMPMSLAEKRDCDCVRLMHDDAIELLKILERIKSVDEFKNELLSMFSSIWDVEIDHPIFQDTVGELMKGVLQAYEHAVISK